MTLVPRVEARASPHRIHRRGGKRFLCTGLPARETDRRHGWKTKAGVYIKFEIHIFVPPPFLIYIFSQTEITIITTNVQPVFCNFLYFKSKGERI